MMFITKLSTSVFLHKPEEFFVCIHVFAHNSECDAVTALFHVHSSVFEQRSPPSVQGTANQKKVFVN